MKKLLLTFSLLAAVMMAKAAVKATIYVQAETAPYLYGWFTINGKETKINGAWPGKQMTEKVTKTNLKGESIEFWYQTFEYENANSFNIIFNNGKSGVDQVQTDNITTIESDRYFTFDETNPNRSKNFTEITEEFGEEIPDVNIESVALLSDLNEWNGVAQLFDEVEENTKFTYNLSLTDEELESIEYYYRFQFMINSSAWIGWNTGVTVVDPNEWIEQDLAQGGGTNFGISFEEETMPHDILFTMEFAGGKDIYQGWTLTVAQGTSGIGAIRTTPNDKNAPRYNLAGQRVGNDFRGLVVRDGRKMLVK